MRLAKWVQSIECEGDGYFILIPPFPAWRQIFLLFLGLCLMVFKIGSRPFQWHVSILEVLEHCSLLVLVMSYLYFLEDLLSVLSEVCSSDLGLLPLAPALDFSSSHNIHITQKKKKKEEAWKIHEVLPFFSTTTLSRVVKESKIIVIANEGELMTIIFFLRDHNYFWSNAHQQHFKTNLIQQFFISGLKSDVNVVPN